MSDKPVAKTSTYTGQHNIKNTRDKQTSMPSAGFEPTIPATKWPQTYTLGSTATGIGKDVLQNTHFKILPCIQD
jgi:hypothetical protein